MKRNAAWQGELVLLAWTRGEGQAMESQGQSWANVVRSPPTFLQEAVQFAKQPDMALSQVARDLALRQSLLRRWVQARKQKGEVAFPGKGRLGLNAEQTEIQRLRRE